MSAFQLSLLVCYALGMAGGQLLFKLAARSLEAVTIRNTGAMASALLQNYYFLAALAVYFALSAIWVWILSFTPLSRAYPFVALAFVATPIIAAIVFGEELTPRLYAGLGLILVGLLLVAR